MIRLDVGLVFFVGFFLFRFFFFFFFWGGRGGEGYF